MFDSFSRAESHLLSVERAFKEYELEDYNPIDTDEDLSDPLDTRVDGGELGTIDEWENRDLDSTSDHQTATASPEKVRGAIDELGVEALAFYKSARYIKQAPFPGHWGIFYFEEALDYITSSLIAMGVSVSDAKNAAHKFLWAHEFFHFKTDIVLSFLEAGPFIPLYTPLRKSYSRYGHLCTEEALANRAAHLSMRRVLRPDVKQFFHLLMDLQPGEYARYRRRLHYLQLDFADQIKNSSRHGPSLSREFPEQISSSLSYPPDGFNSYSACPQHVILRTGSRSIYQNFDLPKVHAVVDLPPVEKHLRKKSDLRERWKKQKDKLVTESHLVGLGFKKWPKGGKGMWSVRVDDGHRAHLMKPKSNGGAWTTVQIGTHTEMGHD